MDLGIDADVVKAHIDVHVVGSVLDRAHAQHDVGEHLVLDELESLPDEELSNSLSTSRLENAELRQVVRVIHWEEAAKVTADVRLRVRWHTDTEPHNLGASTDGQQADILWRLEVSVQDTLRLRREEALVVGRLRENILIGTRKAGPVALGFLHGLHPNDSDPIWPFKHDHTEMMPKLTRPCNPFALTRPSRRPRSPWIGHLRHRY